MARFVRGAYGTAIMLLSAMMVSVFALDAAHTRLAYWTHHAQEVSRVGRDALLRIDNADELHVRLDSLIELTADEPLQNQRVRTARRAAAVAVAGSSSDIRAQLTVFLTQQDELYRRRLLREQRLHLVLPLLVLLEGLLLLFGITRVRRRLLEQTDLAMTHGRDVHIRNERLALQYGEMRRQADQLTEQASDLEAHQADQDETLEQVREKGDQYASLLGSMTDSVYSIGLDQRITAVHLSPEVQRRWSLASVIGRTPSERFGSESAIAHDEANRTALAGTPVTFEWQHEVKGARRFYSTALSPLHDANGNVVGAVGVTRDHTAERQHRLALVESERRLRQAQKLEAVGQLAGGVAHDFNNLLTVIISYTEMLLADLPDHDANREPLQEILHAGSRAAELTKQLLTFSRREAVEARLLDLCDAVSGVEQLLRRMIGRDVTLVVECEDGACPVMAETGQVGQVLMNLVINANAAMPAGGTIRIVTSHVTLDRAFAERYANVAPGPHVNLCVADSGQGMNEETLTRLFEPFFTTKAPGEGTGLGLATVYGIVQHWGGCIEVTSTEGRGSTFCVYLPLMSVPAAQVPRGAHDKEQLLLVAHEHDHRSAVRIDAEPVGRVVRVEVPDLEEGREAERGK